MKPFTSHTMNSLLALEPRSNVQISSMAIALVGLALAPTLGAAQVTFETILQDESLDGWHAVPEESMGDWTLTDGILTGTGSQDRLAYLVWKNNQLKDFVLELEYRLPGEGNTGVEIRCQEDKSGKRPFVGYHADLGHIGIGKNILGAWDFHFADRTEPPCPRGSSLSISSDGKFTHKPLDRSVRLEDIKDKDWNRVRIVAEAGRCEFYLNDKIASVFEDRAAEGRLETGGIALQIHDRGMTVQFRRIRLKELNKDKL